MYRRRLVATIAHTGVVFRASRLLVVLLYIALYFSISIRNYFWHIYPYLKTDDHALATLLKPLPRILESFCRVSVCVHVWVCVSSSRSKALLLTTTWGLPSFTLSNLPTPGRPGGLLPVILPSITNGTRSPCHRLWRSHSLSSVDYRNDGLLPIRLRYRLCQTKKCLIPFSKQPHLNVLLPSLAIFLNVHDSAPYRRALQMTVSSSGKGWRLFSAVVSFCSGYSRSNFLLTRSILPLQGILEGFCYFLLTVVTYEVHVTWSFELLSV